MNELRNSLIHCRKQSYANGEKKKYSGMLNHWVKSNVKCYDWVNGKAMPYDTVKYTFAYKQKRVYDYNALSETERYSLTKSQQQKLLIERDDFNYPHFSYSCAFMYCTITLLSKGCRLTWASGDDDIGNEFLFPLDDLHFVMDYIMKNKNKDTFQSDLEFLIMDNRDRDWHFC